MPASHPLTRRLAGSVDPGASEPIAHQLVEYVWTEVVDGALETGERMPTSREMAVELGVSPRTVSWAYHELERLGVLATRAGEGTFVSLSPPREEERERRRAFLELCGETVTRARALGFDVGDLVGALAEYRGVGSDERSRSGSP